MQSEETWYTMLELGLGKEGGKLENPATQLGLG